MRGPSDLRLRSFSVNYVFTPYVLQSLVDYLETRRSAGEAETRGRVRRRRLQVLAGQAVSVANVEKMEAEAVAAPRA